jgi:hypothetical protein
VCGSRPPAEPHQLRRPTAERGRRLPNLGAHAVANQTTDNLADHVHSNQLTDCLTDHIDSIQRTDCLAIWVTDHDPLSCCRLRGRLLWVCPATISALRRAVLSLVPACWRMMHMFLLRLVVLCRTVLTPCTHRHTHTYLKTH